MRQLFCLALLLLLATVSCSVIPIGTPATAEGGVAVPDDAGYNSDAGTGTEVDMIPLPIADGGLLDSSTPDGLLDAGPDMDGALPDGDLTDAMITDTALSDALAPQEAGSDLAQAAE